MSKRKNIEKLKRKCLKLWKKIIAEKFNHRCALCGSERSGLNAHHIEDSSTTPELRFEPLNGVLLCPRCHRWGKYSVHKSFLTAFKLYFKLNYFSDGTMATLDTMKDDKFKFTESYLIAQIKKLEQYYENITKNKE